MEGDCNNENVAENRKILENSDLWAQKQKVSFTDVQEGVKFRLEFVGYEYEETGLFCPRKYAFSTTLGSKENAFDGNSFDQLTWTDWTIWREDKEFLKLSSNYKLLQVEYCGVCSTDLNRQYLEFPLPQITGHEIIGKLVTFEKRKLRVDDSKFYVVEINCSHYATNQSDVECSYCFPSTLNTLRMSDQCPSRKTIGIDTLPGGFAPFMLVPVNALHLLPSNIPPEVGVLVEPFAAALEAVLSTTPEEGWEVAVVGPRKLGLSIIVALLCWRIKTGTKFRVTTLTRHSRIESICQKLGVDKVIDTRKNFEPTRSFDLVYDTTGSSNGFELSLQLAKKIVHLKSTSGAQSFGITTLTPFVVDELALLPFEAANFRFKWSNEVQRDNLNIYVSPSINISSIQSFLLPSQKIHQLEAEKAFELTSSDKDSKLIEGSLYPSFDLAIISSLNEVDSIIRPKRSINRPLIRARGAILLLPTESISTDSNLLFESIVNHKIQIRSSRCGDFLKAIEMIESNLELIYKLKEHLITHTFPLNQINEAFTMAKNSEKSIKVVIKTQ